MFDTVLSFPAASVALSAATLTDTVPSEDPFTTSKVYVVPELPPVPVLAKLLAAGELSFAVPVTVMSPTTKLDVDSLNVAV